MIRKTNDQSILQMRKEGKSFRYIAAVFGCSKTAVWKLPYVKDGARESFSIFSIWINAQTIQKTIQH
jgi:hypothetical protein